MLFICVCLLGEQSFGGRRTVAALRVRVFWKWRSRWHELCSALRVAHDRETRIRVLRGETEVLCRAAVRADLDRAGRVLWVLLVVAGQRCGRLQKLLLLLAVRYRHPFVNLHRRVADCDPFLLPGNERIKEEADALVCATTSEPLSGANNYQCRTLSTACITLLISSLARLLVSARTDLDMFTYRTSLPMRSLKLQTKFNFVYESRRIPSLNKLKLLDEHKFISLLRRQNDINWLLMAAVRAFGGEKVKNKYNMADGSHLCLLQQARLLTFREWKQI